MPDEEKPTAPAPAPAKKTPSKKDESSSFAPLADVSGLKRGDQLFVRLAGKANAIPAVVIAVDKDDGAVIGNLSGREIPVPITGVLAAPKDGWEEIDYDGPAFTSPPANAWCYVADDAAGEGARIARRIAGGAFYGRRGPEPINPSHFHPIT